MISVRVGNNHYELETELEQYFHPFRQHIIGLNHSYETPYGRQKIIYADWTASGRLYKPIEKKITEQFGPFMANTHTESNTTGSFMTVAYKKAKRIIKEHVHADEHDVLIFDGFGMTSVINKLQRLLGWRLPEQWNNKVSLPIDERPVVFITHFEHHSNQITWEETIADVEIIRPKKDGNVDLSHLEELLKKYRLRKHKIGSFASCSNVTGIITPYHEMAKIMHKHGGICFIDFAASAPYVKIDMHPEDPLEKLDGIFFSPHKFLGGPGTSGVLIFDSRLYNNQIPDHPGGGTVTWTNPWGEHQYIEKIEYREDGGTPGILQGIRTALCIKLKEQMGIEKIKKREKELVKLALSKLKNIPDVYVFEQEQTNRLGIISFHANDVHYNLVVKLLNDRFGYQVRGGCSCAGTYGHYLFQITKNESKQITNKIDAGDLSSKPGWVRFSIHPTMTNSEVYGFINALKSIIQNKEEWKKDYVYDETINDYFYIRHEREDMQPLFQL